MPLVIGQNAIKVHGTSMGHVRVDKVPEADYSSLVDYQSQLFDLCSTTPVNTELVLEKMDVYREMVGALYLKLKGELESDLKRVRKHSNGLVSSMWASLRYTDLRPEKYRRRCGGLGSEFHGIVMGYWNLPMNIAGMRESIMKKWGHKNWREHLEAGSRVADHLDALEKQYREETIIMLQIGIGWGGMILGIIGLLIGFASLFFPFVWHS